MGTSASRCLFWVSSQSHWVQWHQSFQLEWVQLIHQLIAPAEWRYLRRMRCCWLLLPLAVLIVLAACSCLYCWWLFLLVIVIFVGRDRLCCLFPSLYFVNNHWFILVFPPVNLFPPLRRTVCSCCVVQLMLQVHYFFRIKKRIDHLCLVRFLQLAALSDGSILEGGRVIERQCAAYWDCVLLMRVAGSFGGLSSKSRCGVGKNWVLEISVGTNRGAGRVMWIKGTVGFVRFVFKGSFCRAVGIMKLVCLRAW